MHLPDGFLDPNLAHGLLGAALGAVAYAFQTVRKTLVAFVGKIKLAGVSGQEMNLPSFTAIWEKHGKEKIQKMSTIAAFIFAAQMINFPVQDGTSGHFLGGVLAAVICGPLEALLIMTIVLSVQAFIFADGGLIALGANIINMGLIGALTGYGIYYMLCFWFKNTFKSRDNVILLASSIAALISVPLASLACAYELGISNILTMDIVVPAMLNIHILIGMGEALITFLAVKIYLSQGLIDFPIKNKG